MPLGSRWEASASVNNDKLVNNGVTTPTAIVWVPRDTWQNKRNKAAHSTVTGLLAPHVICNTPAMFTELGH
ncbi:hypothetical protein E2C01_051174 [Portunus trituberculatus]|uniref:Uncharacterized protein n=1 Tax=Portunus trituberculatus TaxID=210409 RepID=A0A5B7GI00_PORTR|nr:hypothetical protein [Portunus trituberculatus]